MDMSFNLSCYVYVVIVKYDVNVVIVFWVLWHDVGGVQDV
jgi:hypothetical protein